MTKWHSIKLDTASTRDDIRATIKTGPESGWFKGHFPNEPILPGFALLSMVYDAISLISDEELTLIGFQKIRFKRVVRPDDTLEIKAVKEKNDFTYSFTVISNGSDTCKGTVIMDRYYKKC